jgi:hypothetical protein
MCGAVPSILAWYISTGATLPFTFYINFHHTLRDRKIKIQDSFLPNPVSVNAVPKQRTVETVLMCSK